MSSIGASIAHIFHPIVTFNEIDFVSLFRLFKVFSRVQLKNVFLNYSNTDMFGSSGRIEKWSPKWSGFEPGTPRKWILSAFIAGSEWLLKYF